MYIVKVNGRSLYLAKWSNVVAVIDAATLQGYKVEGPANAETGRLIFA